MMAHQAGHRVVLDDLLAAGGAAGHDSGIAVDAVTLDSRSVAPGAAFVALPGRNSHGLDFLDDALARGATAVLYDAAEPRWGAAADQRCRHAGAEPVAVPGLASRIGAIAAALHGQPSERLAQVVAVTGTDGKTTVAQFVAAMLDDAAAPAAALGTLGAGAGAAWPAGLTTPDAPTLQAVLARLAAGGVRRVALEASSHGLAQGRVDGTRIDVAVLTQLGRDHLDYHGSQGAYAEAKARLFTWPSLRGAAINADDAFGRSLPERLPARAQCITYGRDTGALRIDRVRYDLDGMVLTLDYGGARAEARLGVVGSFNADNAAAAVAALLALGYPFAEAVERLGRVAPVPGRMELFRVPGAPGIVVDYAHTPGALTAALTALRAHTDGRLWCIFGAGGDRDRGKRAPMGAAAAAAADHVIVTDDNPRSEDPDAIVDDIVAGMGDTRPIVEHDRQRALRRALERAQAGDLILLAGKGHETEQERAGVRRRCSDRAAARAALGMAAEGGS